MSRITDRIEREAGVPDLASILAERVPATDLQSLLLETYRLRARRRSPAEVLAEYEANRFVRPGAAAARRLLEWERTAFAVLPEGFEPVSLAPLCPLGTCSAVAAVDQNWAVATARNTEVVSDPTNVLALECAVRRRALLREAPRSTEPVHLAASHRVVRPQFVDAPNLYAHFSLLALCSGSRSRGSWRFELGAIGLHARFYLRALRAFLGPDVPLRFTASDFGTGSRRAPLEAELLEPVAREFPDVECARDDERTSGRTYYADLCFHVHASDAAGVPLQLADGGTVDWAGKLLSNAKERLVISGVGSERVCTAFG